MHGISWVFDIQIESNLLRESLVGSDLLLSVCLCYSPQIKSALRQLFEVTGTIVPPAGMREICIFVILNCRRRARLHLHWYVIHG